jgi:hypothetical protein
MSQLVGSAATRRISTGSIVSCDPPCAALSQTIDVGIVGEGTFFEEGYSSASFYRTGEAYPDEDIIVNSTHVQDQTHLTTNITVNPSAQPGLRDVYVRTR